MESSIRIFLFLVVGTVVGAQEIDALSELPLAELLAQKKAVGGRAEGLPEASAVVGPPPPGHKGPPHRKAFYYDDYEDEKGHVHKKKEEHKIHDVLNTSVMVLSYLAFGGYLLCMIASAIREKRRRVTMAYPTAGPALNNHFVQVLQHHMAHRPTRPFIRFPTVTVHQGRKKRRRRSPQKGSPRGDSPPLFNVIDSIQVFAHGGN